MKEDFLRHLDHTEKINVAFKGILFAIGSPLGNRADTPTVGVRASQRFAVDTLNSSDEVSVDGICDSLPKNVAIVPYSPGQNISKKDNLQVFASFRTKMQQDVWWLAGA